MAKINLTKTCKVNGALVDADSVVLSDRTGTYGVKRDDTDAVVVAAGTAMTKTGTGIYTYSFDEPAPDLNYTYVVKWVYNGTTFFDEHRTPTTTPENDLLSQRDTTKYLTWVKNEFKPLTLATPDATLEQLLENAIRYWNTHSARKVSTMVSYASGTKRVQLSPEIKSVVEVYPNKTTTWIWNDHPLWTLVGITVLDSVTTDLIMMSEAFRNYKIYVGTDFRWVFDPSTSPEVGGHLYCINVPTGVTGLYVVGTKRITKEENIRDEYILDWLLRYFKALVKQVEGNTLRKSGIINIANDGQELYGEGREEMLQLQEQLAKDSRWVLMAKRF